MQLSNQDLNKLDEDELLNLPEEDLRRLSIRLLNDLKEARERLNQNSHNSSIPPSKDAPWDKENIDKPKDDEERIDTDNPTDSQNLSVEDEENDTKKPSTEDSDTRKPGKQLGAKGFGRTQKIDITHYESHYPTECECCHEQLIRDEGTAYTAYETLDILWADSDSPGIRITNTKHTLYKIACTQGHESYFKVNRTSHHQLPDIIRTEWRLVGPGLAAMIICLAYRMRLSRKRIQEFLYDWLGIKLSVGTIDSTLHESGAAAIPLEDEFIKEIVNSELLHVDETSWIEHATLLWLWVFSTNTVTAYWIASRSAELMNNLLGSDYSGWLMSDGYSVYRKYKNRLRCWAHLLRKAEGLKESLNTEAASFGEQTLNLMTILINAVKEARIMPPKEPLSTTYRLELEIYKQLCLQMKKNDHKKSAALATEMLKDWKAIFQVLDQPHQPLTNNEAEQALRHWVILRSISYGTRSEEGTRVFAILISVIETCRKRNQSPWFYLSIVITSQRSGLPVPALPNIRVSE